MNLEHTTRAGSLFCGSWCSGLLKRNVGHHAVFL